MNDKAPQVVPLPQARRSKGGCPICRRAPTTEHRPFCSARCAEIDLGRWFTGAYRVPTDEPALSGDDGTYGDGGEDGEGDDE